MNDDRPVPVESHVRRRDDTGSAATGHEHGWRGRIARFGRDWAVVVLLGTLALLGAAKVGEDVLAHESTAFDETVQRWMLAHETPWLVRVFVIITNAGSIVPLCAVAVAGAGYLWYRGKRSVAAIVMLAPVVAVTVFSVIKRAYARPRPAGLGGIVPSSYAFPSGHATASAAVCVTLAYVFWREGFARRRAAVAFAVLVPLVDGFSRMYLNVHWATDVLGGWSAGLVIAILSIVLYDRNRRRRRADPDVVMPSLSRTH